MPLQWLDLLEEQLLCCRLHFHGCQKERLDYHLVGAALKEAPFIFSATS